MLEQDEAKAVKEGGQRKIDIFSWLHTCQLQKRNLRSENQTYDEKIGDQHRRNLPS
jgi:hypothetical protein